MLNLLSIIIGWFVFIYNNTYVKFDASLAWFQNLIHTFRINGQKPKQKIVRTWHIVSLSLLFLLI